MQELGHGLFVFMSITAREQSQSYARPERRACSKTLHWRLSALRSNQKTVRLVKLHVCFHNLTILSDFSAIFSAIALENS